MFSLNSVSMKKWPMRSRLYSVSESIEAVIPTVTLCPNVAPGCPLEPIFQMERDKQVQQSELMDQLEQANLFPDYNLINLGHWFIEK